MHKKAHTHRAVKIIMGLEKLLYKEMLKEERYVAFWGSRSEMLLRGATTCQKHRLQSIATLSCGYE